MLCGIGNLQIQIVAGIQTASSHVVVGGPEVVGPCLKQGYSLDDHREYLKNTVICWQKEKKERQLTIEDWVISDLSMSWFFVWFREVAVLIIIIFGLKTERF